MMVDYLRVDLEDVMAEMGRTRMAHAIFELKKMYTYEFHKEKHARGDNKQVGLHITYGLRAYLLYLVGIAIFMDNSASYTNVIYL